MSKIVQQIQFRFKFFQIFWLFSAVLTPTMIILSELMNGLLKAPASNANTVFANPLFLFGFLCLGFLTFVISVMAIVFYAMLTHGLFNFFKKNIEPKVDPTWAVWSIFIPFASSILTAYNFRSGFELLDLKSTTGKYNFIYSIFYTVVVVILSSISIYFSFYQTINKQGGLITPVPLLITPVPFMNISFYISVATSILGFVYVYFTWKSAKELKDAVVNVEK